MHKELIISTTPQETKLAILEDEDLVEFYIERHRSQGIVGNIYKGKVTKVLPGMQSAFVDIGLDRDAFLYVSDFFEDTEEYDKIVSTVEEEVANLQEGPPAQVASPQPAERIERVEKTERPERIERPERAERPERPERAERPERPERTDKAEAAEPEVPLVTPLEGETVRPHVGAPAPAEDRESFDRRGPRGRGRDRGDRDRDRDRDRRGKKPKIPSFENKTYESRPERPERADRPEGTFTGLAVLPGESLSKYTPKTDAPSQETSSEARAAGEEKEHRSYDASSDPAPATRNEPSAEASASKEHEGAVSEEPPAAESQSDENPSSSARISDRSDKYRFAHRPARGRQRGRRGGPPPQKTDDYRGGNGHSAKAAPTISELLREGQEILVQVSKEPLGKKGARITSHIALPGRYLVYMPTVDHVGVSRKIASDEERSRLKRIIHENKNGLPGGFIVRTAAEGRGEEEFIQDIRFLGNLWTDI